ncbi:MAG: cytochrome c3 family protein [Candidatus Methanofastidiosia archaeon]
MKKREKMGVATLLLIFLLGYISQREEIPEEKPNLYTLHLNALSLESRECIDCHGDKSQETSLKEGVETPHKIHLTSEILNFECVTCHQKVDIQEGSAASLRRQVDVEFCAKCHSEFSEEMDVSYKEKDCIKCHSDWKEKMGELTFVNLESIQKTDCLKCHGGLPWYGEGRKLTSLVFFVFPFSMIFFVGRVRL